MRVNLTKDFYEHEFKCHCADENCSHKEGSKINPELLGILQRARILLGEPINPTCGGRCFSHNANVGGTIGSSHLTWEAVDLKISHKTMHALTYQWKLIDALMKAGAERIVVYGDKPSIHVDVSKTKTRPAFVVL